MDKNGNLSPSALIPFCDFGGNISILGKIITGLELPVCNRFKQKFLDNQLCYEIDVNPFKMEVDSKQIFKLGLTFIVDTNGNRHIEKYKQSNYFEKTSNIGNIVSFLLFNLLTNPSFSKPFFQRRRSQ